MCQYCKSFTCGEDLNKKHRAANTLISIHESIKKQPQESAAINQEIKITPSSENGFQNMGTL